MFKIWKIDFAVKILLKCTKKSKCGNGTEKMNLIKTNNDKMCPFYE